MGQPGPFIVHPNVHCCLAITIKAARNGSCDVKWVLIVAQWEEGAARAVSQIPGNSSGMRSWAWDLPVERGEGGGPCLGYKEIFSVDIQGFGERTAEITQIGLLSNQCISQTGPGQAPPPDCTGSVFLWELGRDSAPDLESPASLLTYSQPVSGFTVASDRTRGREQSYLNHLECWMALRGVCWPGPQFPLS